MSIEGLPLSGDPRPSTESQWSKTIGALGAGIAIGVVLMWSIGPIAPPAPSASPLGSMVAQVSAAPRSQAPSPASLPIFPKALVASDRQPLTVDDVSLTFSVPADGWARYDDLYISKSNNDSPRAEAMIFWARYPAGQYAQACGPPRPSLVGTTAAELAAGLAIGLPGTELVTGPVDVMVGGLAATQVMLFLPGDYRCGPGYFYTWEGEENRRGPLWQWTEPGDTTTIWVFDIGEERFIIAAEWHLNAGAELEAEIQQIIDSIQFHS